MMAKLLVVEDSRVLRISIRRILIDAGFSVVEASDGEEGIRLTRQTEPDLILLDMMLPKLGGEHVLRALQRDPAMASIPVIVMSSLPQSNEDKLKDEGAITYVEKSRLDLMTGGAPLVRLVQAALRTSKRKIAPAALP